MNANVDKIGFVKRAPRLIPDGVELRRFVGKAARGFTMFARAVSSGRQAAYLAERYYAMNDAQLACIGLTRDQIPSELLRVLSR